MNRKNKGNKLAVGEVITEEAMTLTAQAYTMKYVLIDSEDGILEAIPIDLSFIEE